MSIDINKIRAETPGVQHGVHLLACGAGLMPQPVIDAVVDHTILEAQIGGYEAKAACADQLNGVYDVIAGLVGATSGEIALQENATVAWCQAFYALPMQAGDRILTCEAEYSANYVAFLQRQKRDGIIIDVIPSDPAGALDLKALEAMIDDRVALIAITWVPTNGGLVNPAAGVGKIANKHSIPYLLDACQAVGQMPVDVAALGCDFLSATGRKFLRGPRGTGFLYVRESWINRLEPVMIDLFSADDFSPDHYHLRADARRFENWENSYALRAGLGAATRYAMDIGLETIQARAWGLAAELRAMIAEIPGAILRDIGHEHCAITSFTIEGLDAVKTTAALASQSIIIGASSPKSTVLDGVARGLPTLMRAAPHYYNTSAELEQLVTALRAMQG